MFPCVSALARIVVLSHHKDKFPAVVKGCGTEGAPGIFGRDINTPGIFFTYFNSHGIGTAWGEPGKILAVAVIKGVMGGDNYIGRLNTVSCVSGYGISVFRLYI